jgi:hypothetical protein
VTIRRIGHAPRTIHVLVPREGTVEVGVALASLPTRLPMVQVRRAATVPVRGIDAGDDTRHPDRGVSAASIASHPLLAEPDVLQALAGGAVAARPESPSGLHVRGGASDQVAYLLDGIPVFSPYHAAAVFGAWNPDAISRVHLASAAPPPSGPEALSGVVTAVTRVPGPDVRAQGSVGTAQARLTVDGPLGGPRAGFLVSARSGFPGPAAARGEPSYLRGETGDWLAKVEVSLLGGRLRALAYESENELDGAAAADSAPVHGDGGRNSFEWRSRSSGVEWSRARPRATVRLAAWRALGDAGAGWMDGDTRVRLAAARRDAGGLASVERRGERSSTVAGLRAEWSRTAYGVGPESRADSSTRLAARTPVISAFAQHVRALGRRTDLDVGAALAVSGAAAHLGPRGQLRWRAGNALTLSGSYARLHQFAQSLRNPESVVGNVFPVDLYLGSGAPGVPVARSHQVVAAADYRPAAGVLFALQAYERRSTGLVLAAPGNGQPFATDGGDGAGGAFRVGTGAARGVALDASVAATRYGVVAGYSLQRVRLRHGASTYVPDHGTTHVLEGGVIAFPTATLSLRVGATGMLGRRTTAVAGVMEWEACNLLDRGCEFAGSPSHRGVPLGGAALPAYLRLDVGARKHWHLDVAGRHPVVALFATVTNVLGRRNVLTYATDPDTGRPAPVQMRPRAPLVAGLDWQF